MGRARKKELKTQKEISEILNIESKKNDLLNRGRKLLKEKELSESEFEKINIQNQLDLLAKEIQLIDKNTLRHVQSKTVKTTVELDSDINLILEEINNFLNNEFKQKFVKWETISFLIVFFYKYVLIEYRISNDKTINFADFIQSMNFNNNSNSMTNKNQDEILKKLNFLDRQNLKILYLLLDKFFLDESQDKINAIERIKPFNDKESIIFKANSNLNKQIKDHFVNEKVKNKFRTI